MGEERVRQRVRCSLTRTRRLRAWLTARELGVPPGPVDLGAIDTARHARRARAARRRRATAREEIGDELADLQERLYAEADGRGLAPPRPARPAGHGRLRQGRRHQARPRRHEPDVAATSPASARRPRRSASTTSCGGSAARCPRPGAIGVFDRSHYEDVVAVRARELVAGGRSGARASRRSTPSSASLADDGVHDRQGLPAHLAASTSSSASCGASTASTSAGSSTSPTSRTASAGRRSRPPTRRRWSAATRTRRPGTSSRPTASGTGCGRSSQLRAGDAARPRPAVARAARARPRRALRDAAEATS